MDTWIEVAQVIFFIATALLTANFGRTLVRSMIQRRQVEQTREKQTQLQDVEIAAALQQTFTELSITGRSLQWYSAKVVRVDQESADVKSFYLVNEHDDLLPTFLAGQHLLLERPKQNGSVAEFRCYTLSNDSRSGYWRISVKKNSDSPNSVSRWLHEQVHTGDTVRVRGPAGSFYLQSCTNRNVVLLSAGIGITPMLPMFQETLRRSNRSLHLFAQFRDVDHMPFAESLLNMAHQFPNTNIQLWLSRFPQGVKGSSTNIIREGKFSAGDVCESIDDVKQSDFYLCGPEAWQIELKAQLVERGAAEGNVRYELFQENSQKPQQASPKIATSCSVHFRQSNKLTAFASTYPNLLGFAMESDVPISSGCRSGSCGSCAVRLLQGKVRYTRKPQFQLKTNEILPCVCVPDGNIVVDA